MDGVEFMKKILSSLGLVMFLGVAALTINGNATANADENGSQQTTEASSNSSSQTSTTTSQESTNTTTSTTNGSNTTDTETEFVNHVDFTIKSAKSENARIINTDNVKVFAGPYNRGTKLLKTVNLKDQLVQLNNVATSAERTYYQVIYQGKTLGWINATYLSATNVYELPFVYTSQHFPFDAPNGCEATALKMALSTKSVGLNHGLNYFLKRMPRAKYDQNKGFVGNPYAVNNTNQDWTIYPKALAKFGRQFRKSVYNITGASKSKIIYEVQHGNPVIAATGYRMRKATGHTLVVVGYKRGYFKMADPSSWESQMKSNKNNPVFWVSTSQFMNLYNQEGRKAVLVH